MLYNCNWVGGTGATPDLFDVCRRGVMLDGISVVLYNCNWAGDTGAIPGLFYVQMRGVLLDCLSVVL